MRRRSAQESVLALKTVSPVFAGDQALLLGCPRQIVLVEGFRIFGRASASAVALGPTGTTIENRVSSAIESKAGHRQEAAHGGRWAFRGIACRSRLGDALVW